MKSIVCAMINYTKNILLQPPNGDYKILPSQFNAGKRNNFFHFYGSSVTWWFTEETFYHEKMLAVEFKKSYKDLNNLKIDFLIGHISKAMTVCCVDEDIFNVDSVVFGNEISLFDCRIEEDLCSLYLNLVDKVYLCIKSEFNDFLYLIYVPRVVVNNSFHIADIGVHFINRMDDDYWDRVGVNYKTNGYSLVTNKDQDEKKLLKRSFDFSLYNTALVVESKGTMDSSSHESRIKIRSALAVLISILINTGFRFNKAEQKSEKGSLIFSRTPVNMICCQYKMDPSLLPFYTADIKVTEVHERALIDWHRKMASMSSLSKNRIEIATFYYNLACNSDGVESYVNYFTCLDALFGVDGSVGASIKSGVASLNIDENLKSKTEKLYSLRCDLVHGSCRDFLEWNYYDDYYRHFKSEPYDDIKKLASASLINCFDVMN
mgnify:CR=1 FL=1